MTDFNTMRSQKIAADVAPFVGTGPRLIIGDSHTQAMEQVFGQGYALNGKPTFFAGIAGATFPVLLNSMPWSSLATLNPASVIVACGTNDANNLTGMSAAGDVTSAGAMTMMQVLSKALSISKGGLVVASDPPPESAAGIAAYPLHQVARMLYYLATLPWSTFGWTTAMGPEPAHPTAFVDLYSLLAIPGGSPASAAYVSPCWLDPSKDVDLVHLVHDAYVAALTDLAA
ncbi:MAG: hypothetical protein JWP25_4686 [Bradyrhizobium sp.]|nr:hypothetical protein [Bradyrhizobium sp.]